MNVLIVTPDRVGSTLLQRLITVYMQAHIYDQPVVNLHELTNGIMKYYSPVFNREMLGKFEDRTKWGYYQPLSEVTDLLKKYNAYGYKRGGKVRISNNSDTMRLELLRKKHA